MRKGLFRLALSFALLLAFYGVGEGITWALGLAFPGAVIGMALLAGCVMAGVLDIERVAPAADLLLSQLGLLFVPPAVGVMLYFDLIAADFVALSVGTVVSLIAVLWTTGLTARLLTRESREHD
jgi:holin-like protein